MKKRAQKQDGAPSPTTLSRSLRESKVQIAIEDSRSVQQRGPGQQAGHSPLRIDVATETGALFGNDLTIVNPCGCTNLEKTARQARNHLAEAVER